MSCKVRDGANLSRGCLQFWGQAGQIYVFSDQVRFCAKVDRIVLQIQLVNFMKVAWRICANLSRGCLQFWGQAGQIYVFSDQVCTLHPKPYTLHPGNSTLHPTPYTQHPSAPFTLHPTPHTPHPSVLGVDGSDLRLCGPGPFPRQS
jgi:hypothetical protein